MQKIKENKIGIVVPYRGREQHLNLFLPKICTTLSNQKIPFEIVIVEQSDNLPFNRGKLLNIGFQRAIELGCTYVAFHDVDMLPLEVDYSYVDRPTHIATEFTGDIERIVANDYFGGVTLFPINDFKKINGYSNEYWGWGFEDDDLLQRYRLNFDNHRVKRIPSQVNNTVGIKFDGEKTHIEIPNVFDLKTFTILVSLEPEKLVPKNEGVNEYSIFAVPGYDMGFTYDSFKRYKFETWTYRRELISLSSEISDSKKTVLAVTVDQKKKIIKFFVDGEKVNETAYNKKLRRYSFKNSNFIGKSGSWDNKRQHFKGIIDYFAIWNHSLEEEQIKSIYRGLYMGLTEKFKGYETPHCLELCYDMKISTNSTILDISGNGRNGNLYDGKRVSIEKTSGYKEIIVPWRKKSKFQLLYHDENGYDGNKWKHPETRQNQIRFNELMETGKINEHTDGLNTLKFKLVDEHKKDNVHTLKVEL